MWSDGWKGTVLCFRTSTIRSDVVLHADLHMSNVWWNGSAASALIDFEFARLGPAWADLARICDSVDSDRAEGIVGRHQLLWQCLAEDYPEVFSVSHLGERIKACRLAFELRQLLLWGPPSNPSPADHPQLVLRGLLNEPVTPGLGRSAQRAASSNGLGIASSSSWV